MSKTRLLCCNALYAGLLLAVFAGPLAADDIFYFGPSEKYDASSRFSAVNIRPNHQSSQYLFVVSPKEINKATIEMRGLDGKVWARSPTMKLDAEEVRLIQFEKMPDKKQEEKKPETPSTEPGKTEASPPVPPGNLILPSRENGNDSLSFQFIMVLIEEREKDNKLERVEYPEAKVITILSPDKYITVNGVSRRDSLQFTVSTAEDFKKVQNGKPTIITLSIPPQPSIHVDALGAGSYRRSITSAGETAILDARDLPFKDTTQDKISMRCYLDVDGVKRAFVYEPVFGTRSGVGTENKLQLYDNPDCRFFPGNNSYALQKNGSYQLKPVVKSEERFPIRLELDNANINRPVTFVFDRAGTGITASDFDKRSSDEIEKLISTRDMKVWLEPFGEAGQLLITSAVKDWVIPLDTYQMRGTHAVGVQFDSIKNLRETTVANLVLDDTVPHYAKILNVPESQYKGQPLLLQAEVADKETPISKVVFFIGPPPGPDGKRPADPVQVEGVRLPDSTTLWAAELPLPAESKGVLQVGFTATNEVGLQVTETKNIKLVDAPPPAGNLHVKVLRGSLPQIGLLVKLKDAEGKDKAVATTNNKGIAEFKQLPPGLYSVSAAKADSGVGSKAETAGKVEVDKTTEVKLELRRGNP